MTDFFESNSIYNAIPETSGIKLYRINGLDIPFDPSWKKIGINLSGGADSSCLLTLLSKIIIENNIDCEIHVISYIRCWITRPWQGPIALDVYNKFVEDYPTIKFFRHTSYIPPELEWGAIGPITTGKGGEPKSGDQISVGSFNKYITYKEKFDSIFNATSANPKGSNWEHSMRNREKPASEGTLDDLILVQNDRYVCHPFRFVEKDWIVAQYFKFNKLDLYKLTRSCEGEFEGINYKTYRTGQYVPLCGKCWWCKERFWAENKVNETLQSLVNE
jgi:hypothetical protein